MKVKMKLPPLSEKGKKIRDKIFKGLDIFFVVSFFALYLVLSKKDINPILFLLGSIGFSRVMSHVINSLSDLSFKKGKLEGEITRMKDYDAVINTYDNEISKLYAENQKLKYGIAPETKRKKEGKTEILRRFFTKK